jgi:hypothetical protein
MVWILPVSRILVNTVLAMLLQMIALACGCNEMFASRRFWKYTI